MYSFVSELLTGMGLINYVSAGARAICIVAGIIICIIVRFLVWRISSGVFSKINERNATVWVEAAIDSRLFKRLSNIVIPVIIYIFTFDMPERHTFWDTAIEITLIIIVLFILSSCIRIIDKVYNSCEASKSFPIRGILQVVEIAVFVIGGIFAVTAIVEQNPVVLLGSIGAATAVTSIVFKDPILGFIAGIQLTATGMIKIGDRIELPQHSADGTIIDLNMMTIKIENFDKTITSIPAYTLISEEFINWRGIIDAGARRIKRPVFIDAAGISICSPEMMEKLRQIDLLNDYIGQFDGCKSTALDGNCLTNIGAFRVYITAYLKRRDDIRQDLTLIVRQLEPGGKGIPLEIYAFASATALAEYESIQSDIFEHLYAVIPEFGLELYQSPSSSDIRGINSQR